MKPLSIEEAIQKYSPRIFKKNTGEWGEDIYNKRTMESIAKAAGVEVAEYWFTETNYWISNECFDPHGGGPKEEVRSFYKFCKLVAEAQSYETSIDDLPNARKREKS